MLGHPTQDRANEFNREMYLTALEQERDRLYKESRAKDKIIRDAVQILDRVSNYLLADPLKLYSDTSTKKLEEQIKNFIRNNS